MKRLLIAAAILAMLATAHARPRAYSIGQRDQVTKGRVAYWSMRNSGTTVFDEIGANNATATNSPVFAYTNGAVGNGAYFSGVNCIATADKAWGIASAYSISAWIRTTSNGLVNVIVGSDSAGASNSLFQTRMNADTTLRFVTFKDNSTTIHNFAGTRKVADNAWRHVVFTFGASVGAAIYVDGSVDSTSATTGTQNNASYPIFIAARNQDGDPNYFTGSIDEVLLYTRTLTADEIKQLYRMGAVILQNR